MKKTLFHSSSTPTAQDIDAWEAVGAPTQRCWRCSRSFHDAGNALNDPVEAPNDENDNYAECRESSQWRWRPSRVNDARRAVDAANDAGEASHDAECAVDAANDAGEASHDAECAVDAANDAEEAPNDAERAVDAANDTGEAPNDAERAVDAANDAGEASNDDGRAVDAANDAGDAVLTESRIRCNLFTSNFYTTLICAHFL